MFQECVVMTNFTLMLGGIKDISHLNSLFLNQLPETEDWRDVAHRLLPGHLDSHPLDIRNLEAAAESILIAETDEEEAKQVQDSIHVDYNPQFFGRRFISHEQPHQRSLTELHKPFAGARPGKDSMGSSTEDQEKWMRFVKTVSYL